MQPDSAERVALLLSLYLKPIRSVISVSGGGPRDQDEAQRGSASLRGSVAIDK